MSNFFNQLRQRFLSRMAGVSAETIDEKSRSSVVKRIYQACPVCHKSLDNHSYWRLAFEIVREPMNTTSPLSEFVSEKQWEKAGKVNEWAHDMDIREYDIIRCPNSLRLGLVVVVFGYDIFSNDFVEKTDVLTEDDSKVIMTLAGDQWHAL